MNSPESTVERDLRAIDEALTADAALHPDDEARALQELALALRADAPDATPPFAEELHGRAEAGFPPRPGTARARLSGLRSGLPTLRDLQPVAGLLLVLAALAGGLLALPGGSDDDDGGSSGSSAGGSARSVEPAPPPQAAESADIAPDAQMNSQARRGTGFVPGRENRAIARRVELELSSPAGELERLADRVTAVTNSYGGFVLRSSVSSAEEDGSGEFDLRIPAGRLTPAVSRLSALAPVLSQSQSGRDVTPRRVTAQDRLRAALAERRGLLSRLENATTDTEAEAIRLRLDLVAGEIRGLRADLRALRLRTNYARVSVTLTAAEDSESNGTLGSALDDAGDLLLGGAGVAIRVLAVLLPLGLLALVAYGVSGAWTRRRRESALT